MKVIIESLITLVENENLEKALGRSTKIVTEKVRDDLVSFVIDTEDVFNIAKTHGIEEANKSIDKVLSKYADELKGKVGAIINS
jgi:lipopolysaccharide export system protein LptC